ncbi:helix-turn-helix domain-containing protein [Pinisolibacter aquiterrae]|uniref:helix-turn-helix domain-containing protein n=1 Tax=Pinisolibacter aquiterrae TaxID=2815579 RepID=UPI0023680E55|nr:winged helix-turn-helix domain-containing protein [Pinisolibacter aquiterrae]MCC8233938.1 winged helix-turn-helix domain-containing protein [Pinisolibacter aquiterrae]
MTLFQWTEAICGGVLFRRLFTICRERFGVDYTEAGMLRLMKGLDLSHQKTLPGHPQSDPAAQRDFQKGGWRAR